MVGWGHQRFRGRTGPSTDGCPSPHPANRHRVQPQPKPAQFGAPECLQRLRPDAARCAHRTQHPGHGAQRCRGRGPQPSTCRPSGVARSLRAANAVFIHRPRHQSHPNRHHPDEDDQQHGVQCRRRAANPLLRATTGVGEAVRRIPGRTQPRGQRFAYKGQIVDRVPRRAQPLTDPRARRLGTAASVAPLIKSAPVRIQVPAIQVDSTLMGLGLQNDGTMQLSPTGFPASCTPVNPLPVSWDRRSSPATSTGAGTPESSTTYAT